MLNFDDLSLVFYLADFSGVFHSNNFFPTSGFIHSRALLNGRLVNSARVGHKLLLATNGRGVNNFIRIISYSLFVLSVILILCYILGWSLFIHTCRNFVFVFLCSHPLERCHLIEEWSLRGFIAIGQREGVPTRL